MITLQEDQLTLFQGEQAALMDEARDVKAAGPLEDFLRALRENREPETSGGIISRLRRWCASPRNLLKPGKWLK